MFNLGVQKKSKPYVKDIKHPFPVMQFCVDTKKTSAHGEILINNITMKFHEILTKIE